MKIPKKHQKALTALAATAKTAADTVAVRLRLATNAYREELAAINEGPLAEFNGVVEDVAAIVKEITDEIEDYVADRSERWAESDAASAVEGLAQAYHELETVAAEPFDFIAPEFDTTHAALAEEIRKLPMETES